MAAVPSLRWRNLLVEPIRQSRLVVRLDWLGYALRFGPTANGPVAMNRVRAEPSTALVALALNDDGKGTRTIL